MPKGLNAKEMPRLEGTIPRTTVIDHLIIRLAIFFNEFAEKLVLPE